MRKHKKLHVLRRLTYARREVLWFENVRNIDRIFSPTPNPKPANEMIRWFESMVDFLLKKKRRLSLKNDRNVHEMWKTYRRQSSNIYIRQPMVVLRMLDGGNT